MLGSSSQLDSLLRSGALVARLVPAEALFSWLTRSVSPPPGWLAWALRRERDPLLIRPDERCGSDHVTEVLFVRLGAMEYLVEDTALRSADGHECTGRLRLSLRIVPESTELAAFRKNLLGSNLALTRTDCERYLDWPARQTLSHLASQRSAAELLKPMEGVAVHAACEHRLAVACLAAGLTVDGPIDIQFDSPAYRQVQRRESELARRREEADARVQIQHALTAAQRQHLSQLIDMLEQMRAAEHRSGKHTLMELLQAFNPAERGEFYGAVWHLSPAAAHTRHVAVVSGYELLLFTPDGVKKPALRHRLPELLGPLRSVRAVSSLGSEKRLLVGAATGGFLVDAETGSVIRTLRAAPNPNRPVRGGVNAMAVTEHHILGSHSELGVLAWAQRDGGQAEAASLLSEHTRGAETIRGLCAAETFAWVAVDNRILRFHPDLSSPEEPSPFVGSRAPISALAPTHDRLYAGNTEGQILSWDLGEPGDPSILQRGRGAPIESLDVLDVSGVRWLIAADQQDSLAATVVGDAYSCRYSAGTTRVRRASVAADLFAGMNDNRDRLLLWHPNEPGRILGSVVVPYLTGGSIQDLCLVPA